MHNLSESHSVYQRIVDEAVDFGIFLLDGRGRIETWNAGARAIFGYEPAEIIGQHFSILFTEQDRQQGIPEKELETARLHGRADDTRWHARKDRSLFFAHGVTTAQTEDGIVTGFAKITRDETDRRREEQLIAAQIALLNLLAQDQPLEVMGRGIIQTVSEHLDWDVGALWMVSEEKGRIAPVAHWHAPIVDAQAAAELCSGLDFARGQGLPGQVWQEGQAVWVRDFQDVTRYPRARQATRANMRSAFAFPISHGGRVMAVIEFFSREERASDQGLLPVMTLIGAQIGNFIDRARTARILRASEEQYRLVSETARDAIFTIDEKSVILFCNNAVKRLFGYTPDELKGQPLEVIIPERYREAHRRGIDRYLRTRKPAIPWDGIELPGLHRDGHEFPVEISFGVWDSGTEGSVVFTGFARDVTERKRAAEEIERTLELEKQARLEAEAARGQLQRRADEEAAFRHLASALTGAVEMTEVLYEITNRATQVTRADGVYVERIVGAARGVEVVASAGRGTPPRGLRVGFPGSMTEEIMKMRQPVILADMQEFGQAMAPYLADSCSTCEVLVTPLVAEDEQLGALVLLNSRKSGRTFGDTDVVRARTLGDLTSLALRRVRLLEQEREAKQKAEAAVQVRDETLGIVSHDLRNPLTKIALSADLMATLPPEQQAEMIDTIRSSARQMQRLIQDLLDVARVEAGRLSVDRVPVDADQLLREVCDSNRPLLEQRGLQLQCRAESSLGEILADHDRLIQVFGNLIGNAMKFTPERGLILVQAAPIGEMGVQFSVSDNGPGIPEGDLKNVFRPYWQAKKTAHMGAGLGLAIVRGIVEAHGGTVWAANGPTGGAIFSFTIPRR